MRTEIDTSSTEYHDGWHDGLSNHTPRSGEANYLAGWDEGFRFLLRGAERRLWAALPEGEERRQ